MDEDIEKHSVLRATLAIERSDVCLILIDATEGVTEQDTKVAGLAHEAGKASIIVVNKWDLIEKDGKTMDKMREEVRNGLAFMTYALILFISAKTAWQVDTRCSGDHSLQPGQRGSTTGMNEASGGCPDTGSAPLRQGPPVEDLRRPRWVSGHAPPASVLQRQPPVPPPGSIWRTACGTPLAWRARLSPSPSASGARRRGKTMLDSFYLDPNAVTGPDPLGILMVAVIAYFCGCFNGAVIVSKYILRDV